jgi:outer membrane lipoprotein-sorting protein
MKPSAPGRWAAVIAAALVVASGPARSAPAPVAGIYEYEIEMAPKGQPSHKMTQKIWVKGQRIRRETATPQGKQIVINVPDGMIILIPGKNQAMKMPLPPGAAASATSAMFPDLAKVKKMKKVGTEKVGVYMAEIHEQTGTMGGKGMPQTQTTTRFWISDRLAVPVKISNKMPTMQMTMTLKSAQPKAAVADSMFTVPKGMKIIERSMQQMMPPPPKGK